MAVSSISSLALWLTLLQALYTSVCIVSAQRNCEKPCATNEYKSAPLVMLCNGGTCSANVQQAKGHERKIVTMPADVGRVTVRMRSDDTDMDLELYDNAVCVAGSSCTSSAQGAQAVQGCPAIDDYCINYSGMEWYFTGDKQVPPVTEELRLKGNTTKQIQIFVRAASAGKATVSVYSDPTDNCPERLPGCELCPTYTGCDPTYTPLCDGSSDVVCLAPTSTTTSTSTSTATSVTTTSSTATSVTITATTTTKTTTTTYSSTTFTITTSTITLTATTLTVTSTTATLTTTTKTATSSTVTRSETSVTQTSTTTTTSTGTVVTSTTSTSTTTWESSTTTTTTATATTITTTTTTTTTITATSTTSSSTATGTSTTTTITATATSLTTTSTTTTTTTTSTVTTTSSTSSSVTVSTTTVTTTSTTTVTTATTTITTKTITQSSTSVTATTTTTTTQTSTSFTTSTTSSTTSITTSTTRTTTTITTSTSSSTSSVTTTTTRTQTTTTTSTTTCGCCQFCWASMQLNTIQATFSEERSAFLANQTALGNQLMQSKAAEAAARKALEAAGRPSLVNVHNNDDGDDIGLWVTVFTLAFVCMVLIALLLAFILLWNKARSKVKLLSHELDHKEKELELALEALRSGPEHIIPEPVVPKQPNLLESRPVPDALSSKLMDRNAALEERLLESASKSDELHERLEDCCREKQRLEDRSSTLEAQLVQVTKEATDAVHKTGELQRKNGEQQETIASLRRLNETLEAQVVQLSQEFFASAASRSLISPASPPVELESVRHNTSADDHLLQRTAALEAKFSRLQGAARQCLVRREALNKNKSRQQRRDLDLNVSLPGEANKSAQGVSNSRSRSEPLVGRDNRQGKLAHIGELARQSLARREAEQNSLSPELRQLARHLVPGGSNVSSHSKLPKLLGQSRNNSQPPPLDTVEPISLGTPAPPATPVPLLQPAHPASAATSNAQQLLSPFLAEPVVEPSANRDAQLTSAISAEPVMEPSAARNYQLPSPILAEPAVGPSAARNNQLLSPPLAQEPSQIPASPPQSPPLEPSQIFANCETPQARGVYALRINS
eukprot:TRINITY_DN4174_c2_g1_i1.p1 TRINITY_DN4174_c2_g1~~TRINITY_DN4174_c2_g1_i1.p1  ORF type:complete len:1087 (-),score=150.87 TRINITY_DN4174_c2_g1_i1:490-3717(-)